MTIKETNKIFEQDEKTGHLVLEGFTAREEGNYQCFAVNTVRGNRAVTMSPVTTVRQASMYSYCMSRRNPRFRFKVLQFASIRTPEGTIF